MWVLVCAGPQELQRGIVPPCCMCLQGILCFAINYTMCCGAVLCRAVPTPTQAFKAAERRMTEAQVLQELALDKACLEQLPRKVKEALWKGGVSAMLKAGLTQPQIQRLRGGGLTNQQQPQQGQEQGQEQGGEDLAAASASSSSSSRAETEEGQDTATSSSEASTSGSDSSSRSSSTYGPYLKRQHLFVAATMPALTKADVGKELQKRFPEALWVSGEMLHQVGGWVGGWVGDVLLLGQVYLQGSQTLLE